MVRVTVVPCAINISVKRVDQNAEGTHDFVRVFDNLPQHRVIRRVESDLRYVGTGHEERVRDIGVFLVRKILRREVVGAAVDVVIPGAGYSRIGSVRWL